MNERTKCPRCGRRGVTLKSWASTANYVANVTGLGLEAGTCYACTRRLCYTKTEALALATAWRIKPDERAASFKDLPKLSFSYGGEYMVSGVLVLRAAWDKVIDQLRPPPPWKPAKLPRWWPRI